MAKLTQELRDLIADRVGRFSTDVLVGWAGKLECKGSNGSAENARQQHRTPRMTGLSH